MSRQKSRPDTYVEVKDADGKVSVVEGFMDVVYDENEWADIHLIYLSEFVQFCEDDIRPLADGLDMLLDTLIAESDVDHKEYHEGSWDDFYDSGRTVHQAMRKEVENIGRAWKNTRRDILRLTPANHEVRRPIESALNGLDMSVQSVQDLVSDGTEELIRKVTRKDRVEPVVKDIAWLISEWGSSETYMAKSSVRGKAQMMDAFIGSLVRKKLMIDGLVRQIEAWSEWCLKKLMDESGTVAGQYEEMKANRWENAFENLRQTQIRIIEGGRDPNESRGPKFEAEKAARLYSSEG